MRTTIKHWVKDADQVYRGATARFRRLPDFIIVGTQRGGTSSLYSYLSQHPQIQRASRKEIHFFDRFYPQGEAWYRRQFPYSGGGKISGEATPFYLAHPHAAARIRQMAPHARLIALLRNPVERAISHYYLNIKHGFETLPIEEAMEQEEERLAGEMEQMLADERYYSMKYRWLSYKQRGVYVDQIRGFHQHFDLAQLLILRSEDLFVDTAGVLKQVFSFLDVDPVWAPPSLADKNPGHSKDQVPDAVWQSLREYFRPHNQRLYEYLGRDFQWE